MVARKNANRTEFATRDAELHNVASPRSRPKSKLVPLDVSREPTRGDRSRQRTWNKLIESAHRAIAAKGFDSVTIEDITSGADVGFGTFYNYFTSKDDIASALFQNRAEDIRRIVDAINSRETDKALAITYIQKIFLKRALHDPVWGWFIVRTQGTHQYMKKFYYDRAVQDIKEGIEQGHFKINTAEVVAQLILSALVGSMRSLLEGDAPTLMEEQTVEYLMRMLGLSEDESKRLSRLPLPDYVLILWKERDISRAMAETGGAKPILNFVCEA